MEGAKGMIDARDEFRQRYLDPDQLKILSERHSRPSPLVNKVVDARGEAGTALDLGCGCGVDTVHLAQLGWDVTGIDFVEEALALTQERAEKAGVNVELIEADVEGWRENRSFDLIIDTGLMHTIHLEKIDAYRSVVMQNLKSGGDFVLSHWINLSSEMRVNLKSAEQIAEFFSPDLRTIECKLVEFGSAALTMGFYWMKKIRAAWQNA
jgi:cyclopropane fatty-acyl-phospholipid synthase-like methyltransferase